MQLGCVVPVDFGVMVSQDRLATRSVLLVWRAGELIARGFEYIGVFFG